MINLLKFLMPKNIYIIHSLIEYENGVKINQIEKILYSLEKAEKLKEVLNNNTQTNMRNVIAGLKIKKIVFGISQYEIE